MASSGCARSSASKRHHINWTEGDIAFLKTAGSFSPKDYNDLIRSGYLAERATCHPVIILAAQDNM